MSFFKKNAKNGDNVGNNSYLCPCNLWLAAESGSSFLMNKNAFATVLSTLEPEKFL